MERRIPATTNRVTGQNVPVKLGNKADWRDYILITKPGINVSNLLAVFTAMWLAGKGSIKSFSCCIGSGWNSARALQEVAP